MSVLSMAFVLAIATSRLHAESRGPKGRRRRGARAALLRVSRQSLGHRCPSAAIELGVAGQRTRTTAAKSKRPTKCSSASSAERLAHDQGDLWDSGKVVSDATLQVEYAGKPLRSRTRCHWKVRVWDRDGRVSAWSEPAAWEMALLEPADWKAQWISDGKAHAATRRRILQGRSGPAVPQGVPRRKARAQGAAVRHRLGLLLRPAQRRAPSATACSIRAGPTTANACSTAPTT